MTIDKRNKGRAGLARAVIEDVSVTPPHFGVHPMLFAPFDAQGRMRRGAVDRMVDAAVCSGAHGVAILGELCEARRLSMRERLWLLDAVADRAGGRIRFCVSVDAPDVGAQTEMVRAARTAGASWVMLQPPPIRGLDAKELLRFFGEVADRAKMPVVVRNSPTALGSGLTPEGLKALKRRSPNVAAVKVELDPISIVRLVEELQGELSVVNGRAGLEMTDCLRAGSVGVMPGIETVDLTARIFAGSRSDDDECVAEAERLFRSVTPLLQFLTTSDAHRLLYGKLLLALRLGLSSLTPRPPFNEPHPFGASVIRRWAAELGPLPLRVAGAREGRDAKCQA